jgi:UDP-glucose:(heptosyl)LPS alpha-1,3-glucosyltransferase
VKLAFCLFKYFPFGGLQRDFIRIAKECVRRGHQVDVFTMQWDGAHDPDFRVNLLPIRGLQNHIRAKRFALEIQRHIKHYDLVVGFNKIPGLDVYYAADTCFQAKARAQHGVWYRLTPRYRQWVTAESAVFSPDAKTHILLIAKAQQAVFQRYYKTPHERFHLLPPGVSKDRVAPSNADVLRQKTRDILGINENEFLLLLVGSGFKTKGLDRALLGIAALPSDLRMRTHFYVIGKDHSISFQRQAKELGISDRVHFLGGRNDIPSLLLAADVLLHPAYNENTGTVLLEAMVAGLPVLTTDVCGYAHYVLEANAGYVMESPFQQTEFNKILAYMLLSPERGQWQKNAITFSRTADIYNMPIRAVDLLESFQRKYP